MKLSAFLPITTVLGCLHTEGFTESGTGNLVYAFSNDNGATTCTNDWGYREDQDGHWSPTCLPGYVYAFTKDASRHWYSNGIYSFSWTSAVSTVGHTIQWDNWINGFIDVTGISPKGRQGHLALFLPVFVFFDDFGGRIYRLTGFIPKASPRNEVPRYAQSFYSDSRST
ncbi:hypothetical protein SUNI508_05578 [Seiridium unicorne]|uniref:Uncharacterized protein n=1 Tax=Seiridium unicorne TaxID=138068 RepID=A0ABR2V4V5_9PEZI